MPELPEVETTARLLAGAVAGARIEYARAPGINALRSFEPPLTALVGEQVLTVRRRGKHLIVESSGGLALLMHLMSAGRLQLYDKPAGPRDRSSRLLLGLEGSRELRLREFGSRQAAWVKLLRMPVVRSWSQDLTETQDLVQETLLSAFGKIVDIEIRNEGSLQAYLRQVLLNRIRMEIRRVGRRPAGVELDSNVEASDASPLELAIGAETLERYERALATLRAEERELVVARVEFGFTNEEVARAFGKPSPDAARMAVQRALLRLTEQMTSDDDSTPA